MSTNVATDETNSVDPIVISEHQDVNTDSVEDPESVEEVEEVSDDTLIDSLTEQLQSQQMETPDTDENAPPPEEPLPEPDECVKLHLGERLVEMMGTRSENELKILYQTYSLGNMGVSVEKLHRAWQPHWRTVQMMQQYEPKQGTQQRRKQWRQSFNKMYKTYEDAHESYLEQRDELRDVVRIYLNGLEDKEQHERRIATYDQRPFSKAKRGHFWRAVEADDATVLLETLDSLDFVKRARWGVFRPSKHTNVVDNRPLLYVLGGNRRGVPSGGAVNCMKALLKTYPSYFTLQMVDEAIEFMDNRNLTDVRHECVSVLKAHKATLSA